MTFRFSSISRLMLTIRFRFDYTFVANRWKVYFKLISNRFHGQLLLLQYPYITLLWLQWLLTCVFNAELSNSWQRTLVGPSYFTCCLCQLLLIMLFLMVKYIVKCILKEKFIVNSWILPQDRHSLTFCRQWPFAIRWQDMNYFPFLAQCF